MQNFSKNGPCAIQDSTQILTRLNPSQSGTVGAWHIVIAMMFRSVARVVVSVGVVSVSVLASVANAQISPDLPNPSTVPNPLTATLSLFRSNMQDKIMKSAEAMPESKYSYRPTKDVRSFAEILNHVTDISNFLCSNMKGEATPPAVAARSSKAEIMAALKSSFDYCDGAFSGFTDAHLNDPADFFGHRTNKMFILTQVGNHDALHYGNLVTYLRINGLEPSGGWF
jgi:uncharacterized damage-inducible protein DinB